MAGKPTPVDEDYNKYEVGKLLREASKLATCSGKPTSVEENYNNYEVGKLLREVGLL